MHNIKHADDLLTSPALPIALEGIQQMVRADTTVPGQLPDPANCSVFYAVEKQSENTSPVGLIAYRIYGRVVKVELAYVEPSSRRMGVFRSMVKHIKNHAQNMGLALEIEIAANNEPVLDIVETMAFEPAAYRYRIG